MRYAVDPERHAAIFGPKDDLGDEGPGRSRKCRTCGGWHRLDRPWPHNCRPPAPPRNPELATPQVAPPFQPFKTGVLNTAEVITNRYEKQEYMKRNDLIEHDPGIGKRNDWVEEYDNRRDIIADIKRFEETDPLNLPPEYKAQPMERDGSLADGTEIETSNIEVIEDHG